MKRLLIPFLYVTILSPSLMSQGLSYLVFDTKVHDFGSFSEDDDNRTFSFRFTNQGKESVAIAHVQTSCGCATANYTHLPITAGKTGVISVTYNPQGRPGRFNRSILVSFTGKEEKVKLNIKGQVTPGVTRKDKRYPYVMGDLQLKATGLRFSAVRGREEERSIRVINSGKTPLHIRLYSSDPTLSGTSVPEVLLPDSIGELKISHKKAPGQSPTVCVRLKEKKTQPLTGYVFIDIGTEPCKY